MYEEENNNEALDNDKSTVTENISAVSATAALIGAAVGVGLASSTILGIAAISAGTASALRIINRKLKREKEKEIEEIEQIKEKIDKIDFSKLLLVFFDSSGKSIERNINEIATATKIELKIMRIVINILLKQSLIIKVPNKEDTYTLHESLAKNFQQH